MLRESVKISLLTVIGTAILAVAMAVTIYYRASHRASPDFLDVASWQLAIWLPWTIFAALAGHLERRFDLSKMHIANWFTVHFGLAILIAGAHAVWFFHISNYVSPYYGLSGTRYGVFAYFFIFWFVIDVFIYWILIVYLQGDRSLRNNVERAQELERVTVALHAAQRTRLSSPSAVQRSQFITVRKRGKQHVIDVTQIDWIEAQDYYAALHLRSGVYLIRKSLRDLMDQLGPDQFIRVHRSTIVNINFIKSLESMTVNFIDGTSRRVSRTGKKELQKHFRRLA